MANCTLACGLDSHVALHILSIWVRTYLFNSVKLHFDRRGDRVNLTEDPISTTRLA